MDTRAIIPGLAVTTAVFDNQIYGFKPYVVTLIFHGIGGDGKKTTADAAGIGQGFKLGRDATEVMADVVGRVDFTPFLQDGGLFVVQAFQADVDVSDCGGEILEDGTHGGVRFGFRFRIGAVPFSEVWNGAGNGVEVGLLADDIPCAFQDESGDFGENRQAAPEIGEDI